MKISDINNQKRTQKQIFLRLANPAATLSQYSPKFCGQKLRDDNLAKKSINEIDLSPNCSPNLYGYGRFIIKYSSYAYDEAKNIFLQFRRYMEYVQRHFSLSCRPMECIKQHFLPLRRCTKWPIPSFLLLRIPTTAIFTKIS